MNITKNGLFLSIVLLTTLNALKGADTAGIHILQGIKSVGMWQIWAVTKGPVRLGGVVAGTVAELLQTHRIPITEKENRDIALVLAGVGILVDCTLEAMLNDTISYDLADLGPYACKFMLSALVSAGIAYTGKKAINRGRKAISKIAGALPGITARIGSAKVHGETA